MIVEHPREYVINNLQYALNPKSIAVVGASRYSTKVGYKVVDGLQTWGYKGKIYPVNPRSEKVGGLDAYPTVKDIPDEIDLAFLAVPAHIVKSVLEDCVAKKVKIVVIATSAFKEIGRGTLQDELTQYCRDNKLPLIGPNLVGMGSPYLNFNCGFIPYLPIKGPVAMISQSGANLLAALGTSQKDHYGMSFFVGLGNKADVDFCEFVSYAGRDENTKCLAVYIEGLDSPDAFIEACQNVDKPIATTKVVLAKRAGHLSSVGDEIHGSNVLGHLDHIGSLLQDINVVSPPDIFFVIEAINDCLSLDIINLLEVPFRSLRTIAPSCAPAYEVTADTRAIAVTTLMEVDITVGLLASKTDVHIADRWLFVMIRSNGIEGQQAIGLQTHFSISTTFYRQEATFMVHILYVEGGIGDGSNLPKGLDTFLFIIQVRCHPFTPELSIISSTNHVLLDIFVIVGVQHATLDAVVTIGKVLGREGNFRGSDGVVGCN